MAKPLCARGCEKKWIRAEFSLSLLNTRAHTTELVLVQVQSAQTLVPAVAPRRRHPACQLVLGQVQLGQAGEVGQGERQRAGERVALEVQLLQTVQPRQRLCEGMLER